ncbi:hypothetical protein O0L34_g6577 [Tuta absoluta]|nr:hypothetical protein O0L34_g6577 [Tuta absoluta]
MATTRSDEDDELFSFGKCRCCLKNGYHKDLTESYCSNGRCFVYREAFLDCYNVTLARKKELTNLICKSCIHRLNDAKEFKTLVLESERRLLREINDPELCQEVKVEREVPDDGEDMKHEPEDCSMDYDNDVDNSDPLQMNEPSLKENGTSEYTITEHEHLEVNTSKSSKDTTSNLLREKELETGLNRSIEVHVTGSNHCDVADTNQEQVPNRLHNVRSKTSLNDGAMPSHTVNTATVVKPSNLHHKNDNTKILELLQSNQKLLLNLFQACNTSLQNQNVLIEKLDVLSVKFEEKVDTLTDNQKRNTQKVNSLSSQIYEGFNRLQKTICNSEAGITLGTDTDERKSFEMKPIDSAEDLENLELVLSDETQKNRLTKLYSILCTKSSGNGGTCAYKLLDVMFTRDFICKCSWSGGSRGKDIKIGFKQYKNVLNFFFSMVHYWDPNFTIEDNERFFKVVLRNALKRKEMKNLRATTARAKRSKTRKSAEICIDEIINDIEYIETQNIENLASTSNENVIIKQENSVEDLNYSMDEQGVIL